MSLVCHSVGADGPSTRVELQEWLFWLGRRTALHWASSNGHTETALALVQAGADVHGKNSLGYGSRGCILVLLGCHCAGRTVRPFGGGAAGVAAWLCRRTALHLASQNGQTETALALCRGGRSVHSAVELR